MRYVELCEPIEIEEDGGGGRIVKKLYTLLDLADFAARAAKTFNADFASAVAGASLKKSITATYDEWRAETGGSDGAPGVGTILSIEDDPWRRFVDWCEKPELNNGATSYPIGPAAKLVPMIERLKAAKAEKPKPKVEEKPEDEPSAKPAEQPS